MLQDLVIMLEVLGQWCIGAAKVCLGAAMTFLILYFVIVGVKYVLLSFYTEKEVKKFIKAFLS